jgi:hypothetical protein
MYPYSMCLINKVEVKIYLNVKVPLNQQQYSVGYIPHPDKKVTSAPLVAYNQSFGSRINQVSGSGSVFGIRIRIRIQDGKNDPPKKKTVKKFHVLKCWMFSFESREAYVLYGDQGIGEL